MKKIVCLLILISIVASVVGCHFIHDHNPPGEEKINEYGITKIIFTRENGADFSVTTNTLDFKLNSYIGVTEYEAGGGENINLTAEFDKEKVEKLLKTLDNIGLFDLRENYESDIVCDAPVDPWELRIEYADGDSKLSEGTMDAAPIREFGLSSNYIYEFCGYDMFGMQGYVDLPPQIGVSFSYDFKGKEFLCTDTDRERHDFIWDGTEYDDNLVNGYYQEAFFPNSAGFIEGVKYNLLLDTKDYGNYEKFMICEVWSCNPDIEQSEMRLENISLWFDKMEFRLWLNKIYIIKLRFSDDDFVEYVFNTIPDAEPSMEGIYYNDPDDSTKPTVRLYGDNKFIINTPENGGTVVNGSYQIEEGLFGDQLVLSTDDGEEIVFDYYARSLYLNKGASTADLDSLGLDLEELLFCSKKWTNKK